MRTLTALRFVLLLPVALAVLPLVLLDAALGGEFRNRDVL